MANTSSGLKENTASLLCYLLGWITGLVFVLMEKKNKTVRFHALQSIIVFGALHVLWLILRYIPIIGSILGLLSVVLWIVLMVKAYQAEMFKIPIAADLAEKYV